MPGLDFDAKKSAKQDTCDRCHCHLELRIYHYEGWKFCSRLCFEMFVGQPIFESGPFPSQMKNLRANVR